MEKRLSYSDHIDYLLASVIYLATQRGWWARTPENLAAELSLDEDKLLTVFEGFPGIFRKSRQPSPKSAKGQYFYALQARYAQREDYGEDEQVTDIPPLATDKIRLIYDFILKSADDEKVRRRTFIGNGIAAVAAIVSAVTAITVAVLKT